MYALPVFNLLCNIYDNAAGPPPIVTPRLQVSCNLARGKRTDHPITLLAAVGSVPLPAAFNLQCYLVQELLLPKLTDIRGPMMPSYYDYVEVPAASGRWYYVAGVDDAGKGFSNEHRVAYLIMTDPVTEPLP